MEIDQVAQEEQRSRSELPREAVRLYLQQRHRRCDTSVSDAVFVALAQALPAPLVTANDRLAQRTQGETAILLLQARGSQQQRPESGTR